MIHLDYETYSPLDLTEVGVVQETGLSSSQVQYRLNKANIRRADFRNGLTVAARKMAREPMSAALDRRIDRLCRQIDKLRLAA